MTIEEAARDLWKSHKDQKEIIGCGISIDDKGEYINVLITKEADDFSFPETHHGHRVQTQITGEITLQNLED